MRRGHKLTPQELVVLESACGRPRVCGLWPTLEGLTELANLPDWVLPEVMPTIKSDFYACAEVYLGSAGQYYVVGVGEDGRYAVSSALQDPRKSFFRLAPEIIEMARKNVQPEALHEAHRMERLVVYAAAVILLALAFAAYMMPFSAAKGAPAVFCGMAILLLLFAWVVGPLQQRRQKQETLYALDKV